jgi:hypothetical protein
MTVTLTLATILAVAGCGSSSGGSSNADPKDVAAVARQVAEGNEFSKAQAQCVAEHATSKLSAKGLKAARKPGSSDLDTLSKADQEAVFGSVSACVTTAQLVPAFTKSLESGSDKVDAKSAKCASKALVSLYPDAGDMMRDLSSGKTSKFQSAMLKCVTGSAGSGSDAGSDSGTVSNPASDDADSATLKQMLVSEMTDSGMPSAEANCVADKVLGEVSTADLAQAGSAGSLPADLESKVVSAVGACASAG